MKRLNQSLVGTTVQSLKNIQKGEVRQVVQVAIIDSAL